MVFFFLINLLGIVQLPRDASTPFSLVITHVAVSYLFKGGVFKRAKSLDSFSVLSKGSQNHQQVG